MHELRALLSRAHLPVLGRGLAMGLVLVAALCTCLTVEVTCCEETHADESDDGHHHHVIVRVVETPTMHGPLSVPELPGPALVGLSAPPTPVACTEGRENGARPLLRPGTSPPLYVQHATLLL